MAKKRIYEVAKELDIENKIVVKKAQDLGFDVKSHMSSLDDKQVSKLVDSLKSTNTTPSTEKDSKNSSRKEKSKIKVSVGAIRRRDNKNEHDNRHGNNKHRNNNFKKPEKLIEIKVLKDKINNLYAELKNKKSAENETLDLQKY